MLKRLTNTYKLYIPSNLALCHKGNSFSPYAVYLSYCPFLSLKCCFGSWRLMFSKYYVWTNARHLDAKTTYKYIQTLHPLQPSIMSQREFFFTPLCSSTQQYLHNILCHASSLKVPPRNRALLMQTKEPVFCRRRAQDAAQVHQNWPAFCHQSHPLDDHHIHHNNDSPSRARLGR